MKDKPFPTIHLLPDEIRDGAVSQERLALALTLFKTYGCLLVENAFPSAFIAELNTRFCKKYRRYLVDKDHRDVVILSRGRYQVTIRLESPFNDSRLYASPPLLQILRSLLGENCMIDSFGAAVSIPGAETQVIHRDFPGLFNDAEVRFIITHFRDQLLCSAG